MDAIISFRLPVEMKDQVEQIAKRSLLSVADVARIAMLEKLNREKESVQPEVAPIGEEPR